MSDWAEEMKSGPYRDIIVKFKEEKSDRAAVLISMHFLIERLRQGILKKLGCISEDQLSMLMGDSADKTITVAYKLNVVDRSHMKLLKGLNRIRNYLGHSWVEDLHDGGADELFVAIPDEFHNLYLTKGGAEEHDNRHKWLRLWYNSYAHITTYKGDET